MRIFLRYIYWPIVVIATMFLSSCMSDDRSNCPSDTIKLYFSFTDKNTYAAKPGIDPTEVGRVNLFAFDNEGKFIREWIDETPTFGKDYYIEISMVNKELNPNATYTFVAWLGFKDTYAMNQYPVTVGTDMENIILTLDRSNTNEVVVEPNTLMHGRMKDVYIAKSTSRLSMGIVQDTYKVNVTTEGITHNADEYQVKITDDNGDYKFDNSFASFRELYYIKTCTKGIDMQPKTSIKTMRLFAERNHPILELINTTADTKYFRQNLIDLIATLNAGGANIDLTTTYELDIHLKFSGTGGANISVEVDINGWKITIDDVGLGG